MFSPRILSLLLAAVSLLAAAGARGSIGIEPIADQNVPSGKTLVVPIVARDASGPPRSYTFRIGAAKNSGTTTLTKTAAVMATIRTGDPHLILGVSYTTGSNGAMETSSNGVMETGTMEFQLLREFSPITTANIGGLTQGGFYSPTTTGTTPKYITFHRVVPGFAIQGGDPLGNGEGGPGFTFQDEFNSALIFSGSAGQLAMANSNQHTNQTFGIAAATSGDTDGSQFFISLSSANRASLDFGFTIFGQMVRGYSNLTGIANTLLEDNGSGEISKPVSPVDITSANLVTNNTDAVLIISATGVCDAPMTVTATSGTESVTRGFMVHAFSDTFSDPPFAGPLPDITGSNGTANVPIAATDLQLDLIQYGFQQFLPTDTGFVSASLNPTLSLPLVSNTDNVFGAEVDSFVASGRGFQGRPFHIAAGANPLKGSTPPIPAGTFGKLNLVAFPIALFSSGNTADKTSSFTATVNFGDGTVLSGTTGFSIVTNGTSGFKIVASHEYTHPGEFPVLVNISDPAGARLALKRTAIIAPSAIGISAEDITHAGPTLTNAVLATFKDLGPDNGKYFATVNWGDGRVTAGTISGTNPNFQVLGTHTYSMSGAHTISTIVARTGTSASYSASAWSTVHLSEIPGPQVFPPFPQAHIVQIWNNVTTGTLAASGTTVQYFLSGSVTFLNCGNKPSTSGSFSAYAAPNGVVDNQATIMSVQGYSSFPVQALNPGDNFTFDFEIQEFGDARLVLPPGVNPTGDKAIGVVTYSDPVGDFDGSQKIIDVTSF